VLFPAILVKYITLLAAVMSIKAFLDILYINYAVPYCFLFSTLPYLSSTLNRVMSWPVYKAYLPLNYVTFFLTSFFFFIRYSSWPASSPVCFYSSLSRRSSLGLGGSGFGSGDTGSESYSASYSSIYSIHSVAFSVSVSIVSNLVFKLLGRLSGLFKSIS